MKSASNGAITEEMPYLRSGFFTLGRQELYVSRTGFTGELGFEIYSDGAQTDHLALWDHLMKVGAPYGMAFSSTRSLTIRRIEAGILGSLTDIHTTMTPFEAGLAPFINMNKGDFIGREALIDADRRCLLVGLTCQTETPAAGSVIIDAGTAVGHITAGVPSPTLGCGIGYARFNHPGDWIGRSMHLQLTDGSLHTCDIVNLTFFDPDKNIVRGINRAIPD